MTDEKFAKLERKVTRLLSKYQAEVERRRLSSHVVVSRPRRGYSFGDSDTESVEMMF